MAILFILSAGVTFFGAGYLGYLAFELAKEDLESHTAKWRNVGADFLVISGAVCGLITALHSFAATIF